MRNLQQQHHAAKTWIWRTEILFSLAICGLGCQSPDPLAPDPLAPNAMAPQELDAAAKKKSRFARLKFWERDDDDLTNTDNIRGPLERILGDKARRRKDSLAPLEGSPEFDEAKELYKKGEYAVAEKRFKRLAKAYKDSPIEEDSLFMAGECQFAQGRFSQAQDSYGKLLKKYPSPRDLDTVTKRLFTIAQNWLEFPEVVTSSEVQTVSMEDPKSTPPPEPPHPAQQRSLAVGSDLSEFLGPQSAGVRHRWPGARSLKGDLAERSHRAARG